MKTAGIYQITCIANGRKYIGSSMGIEDRLKNHKRLLSLNKHRNQHLQNAWNKHTEENFIFEVLTTVENATKKIVRQLEQELLDYYFNKDWDLVFNLCTRVDTPFNSDNVKAKRAKTRKNNPPTEEYRNAASQRFKELWQDPEFREKTMKNHKIAMSKPELIDKHSKKTKELWQTSEYREKIQATRNLPEIKLKTSKKAKERWEDLDYRITLEKNHRKSGAGIKVLKSGNFSASITVRGKCISLGTYLTRKEALNARLKAETKYWDENCTEETWEVLEKEAILAIKSKKSGRGIFCTKYNTYRVHLTLGKSPIYLGSFKTYEEALAVRLKAEDKYWNNNDQLKESISE